MITTTELRVLQTIIEINKTWKEKKSKRQNSAAMAEAAAARREARRRRILENSHNRLQQISGKSNDESLRVTPVRTLLVSEETYDFPTTEVTSVSRSSSKSSLNNGALVTEPDPICFLPPLHDIDAAAGDNGAIFNDFAGVAPVPQELAQPPTSWEKLTTYRLDVVILSLLLQVFYSLSTVEIDNVYLFLPLAIHVVTKLIWLPTCSQSSIINALLMLQGLSPERVQKVMFFAQLATTFSQDVCIFLFTTICMQSIYNLIVT